MKYRQIEGKKEENLEKKIFAHSRVWEVTVPIKRCVRLEL